MNRKMAVITLILASFIFLPTVLTVNCVSAQSSGYTIQSVEHTVEVMYSGCTVVRDDIKVSGSVVDGFQIGIPSEYASSVLKVVAFDSQQGYTVESVSQLGGQSGFYVAQINFEGKNPQSFTVEFVLSNNLISQDYGYYQYSYPAYPALTMTASQCKVTLSLPTDPSDLTITKSDGDTNSTTYSKNNLAAFTSIPALATFWLPTGLLQLMDINTLDRQITIAPSGVVSCQDRYVIKNLDVNSLTAFLLSLPSDAENIVIRDGSGLVLENQNFGTIGSVFLLNATLSSYIYTGQSAQLIAEYTLPSISTSNCNFTLFPAFNYFVNQATFTVLTPEGASIASSDSSAKITANGAEQKLAVTRQDVTYVDYQLPGYDFIQFTYGYSPLWSSFRPTIIAFGFSAVACLGIVFWRKRKPEEEKTSSVHLENTALVTTAAPEKVSTGKTGGAQTLRVTPELVHKFIDAYEDRTELFEELKALDVKVQKGRLPRSQYKIQKRTVENRVEGLTHSINESKQVFRNSSPAFVDLMRQLDLAEADLANADARLASLEMQRNSGEINIEKYKETIGDLEEAKKAAESAVNGILLRLREKMQ